MDSNDTILFIVLIVLLALSAFFSSAETALTTVNRIRIRNLADEGNKNAKTVLKITDDSSKMLTAILIGNNIVNLSAASLTTTLAYSLGGSMVAIASGILTVAILLFGEITPKTMATIHAEKVSLAYAPIIHIFMKIMTPFVFIINGLTNVVLFILRVDPNDHKRAMTENELRTIVNVSHEDGVIESEEKEMINNVFDFGDALAKEVMVPRIDMTFAQVDSSYDEILDICREYDVTISLGDACRPGCLADASDVCQIEELVRLGELTKRAWEKDVQVMVEGPGHMPMDQIAANMKIQQTICGGAPFYVLGPLVTDIAPGYDHITSAIGGAIAAASGAAFLCYVTPAEHLALPNVDDVKQGIIASKIAAHAADIAKNVRGAREMDDKMADARRVLDWDAQWECAMDPETAKRIWNDRKPEHEDTCSMCGKFCAVRSMNKALAGEHIDIL